MKMSKEMTKKVDEAVTKYQKATKELWFRAGKCKKCGHCCQYKYLTNKITPQFRSLLEVMFGTTKFTDKTTCKFYSKRLKRCMIYPRRPEFCKSYPLEPADLVEGCGYYFINKKTGEKIYPPQSKRDSK